MQALKFIEKFLRSHVIRHLDNNNDAILPGIVQRTVCLQSEYICSVIPLLWMKGLRINNSRASCWQTVEIRLKTGYMRYPNSWSSTLYVLPLLLYSNKTVK